MKVSETNLPGVLVIEPDVFGDSRGFFQETFNARRYRDEAGLQLDFVQDNRSRSSRGVLRGLHFQIEKPQGKLVFVTQGSVFDVAVDIDPTSKTYREWYGLELSGDNHTQLYVPPGYAHGFYVLSDIADFQYKCTDFYDPQDEGGIRWDDPSIAIDWPLEGEPRVSEKDQRLPFLDQTA